MVSFEVGRRIRDRRLKLGLTQLEVAHGISRTRAYVSALERGVEWDPDADVLVALAVQLGWPGEHILSLLGRPHFPADVRQNVGPVVLAAITAAVRLEIERVLRGRVDGIKLGSWTESSSDPQDHPFVVEAGAA
jgi:hypothetical protein